MLYSAASIVPRIFAAASHSFLLEAQISSAVAIPFEAPMHQP
jgi:hypothetical protein